MRIRFTLFLLIANLAVFGLIWNNAHRRNREQPPAELVFPVNADHIALASTESPEGSYELIRKEGRWNLTAPVEWPANAWTVQKILDELRFVSRDSSFTLEEAQRLGNTLASYGLDKPRLTLTVGAEKADSTVKIGAATPDGRAAYLLAPDGKSVLIAPKSLLVALLRTPGELRQQEVFSVQPFEVGSVAITLAGKSQETRIGLVRGKREIPGREAEFIWRFETPVASDADTTEVEKQLSALGELRFRKFLPGSPDLLDKAGLATPAFKLALEGNNRRQTLLVGAVDTEEKSPHLYAKFEDNPAVFTIPAESVAPWREVRVRMREHRFLRFEPGELTGITVHSREGGIERSLVLHRLDAPGTNGKSAARPEWRMPLVPGSTATAVTPADTDLLAALENSLANLTANDFGPPPNLSPSLKPLCDAFVTDEPTPEQLKAWGLETPVRKVDLAFRDGTKRTLLIAAPIDRGMPHHAKLVGAPTVYSISNAILDALSVKPEAYRRRSLFSMPAGARLASVKITDLATKKTLVDEKKPDEVPSWETWLEKREKRERDEILALTNALRELRAQTFLGAAFSENYRYDAGDGRPPEGWRYLVEWTVKLPAGTEDARTGTHKLHVTRRLGGTEQLAGSEPDNAVFSLTDEWISALFPVTFGRDSSVELPPIPTPETPSSPPSAK